MPSEHHAAEATERLVRKKALVRGPGERREPGAEGGLKGSSEKIAGNYSIQLLVTVYQSPASAFMIFKSPPLPQKNSIGTIETLCAGWGEGAPLKWDSLRVWGAERDLQGLMAPRHG